MAGKADDPPRSLLDNWRELNRSRDGAPSRLLQDLRIGNEGLQRFANSPHGRQLREQLLRMQGSAVAGRLMGRMRPAAPDVVGTTKRKRKHGGGRHRSLSRDQIEEGIRVLHSQPSMTVDAARATLRAAGINGSDSALYRLIIAPAYRAKS